MSSVQRVRVLGSVVLAASLAACGAGRAVPGTTQPGTHNLSQIADSSALPVTDPPSFVLVTGGGLTSTVELRSPASGRIVRVLGTFGSSFTNNGLALSPKGTDVYVTLIGHRSLLLERISVATRKRTFVADGEQPALSPDGRLLAYVSGTSGHELSVRDLSTGRTRAVDLARLLGSSTDLLDGAVTWLGDGSEIVVMPAGAAVPLGDTTTTVKRPARGTCSAVSVHATCLIVVDVSTGQALAAHRVVLGVAAGGDMKFAGDDVLARSLLLANWNGRRTVVDRVDLSASGARIVRLLSLPPVLPLAFDPAGTRLLYLAGHGPVALWITGFARGRQVDAHRLIANAQLGNAAW